MHHAPKDAVEVILDRLPAEHRERLPDGAIRKKIVSAARDLLRRLGARQRVGFVRIDSAEARAAVVLEHVLRRGVDGWRPRPVPLDVLGKQIGMNKRTIERVQASVEHYLSEIDGGGGARAMGGGSTTAGARRHGESVVSGSVAPGVGVGPAANSMVLTVSDTIRDLSIRLGSMLQDPDGCARRAELLFDDIIKHMQSSKHDRHASLTDVRKNQTVYEAACFYLSAQSELAEAEKAKVPNEKKLQQLEDDEEMEGQLTELDIVRACKLSENKFSQIFRRVVELSKMVKCGKVITCKKRKRAEQKSKLASNGTDVFSEERKQMPRDNDASIEASLSDPGRVDKGRNGEDGIHPEFVPSEKYASWKESVLNEAKKRAKLLIQEESGTLLGNITDGQALERAAGDVLRQHGCLF